VEALQLPDLQAGRVREYLTANRLTAQSITDKPVLAGCIGPFSLAGRLFGMTEIMMALYTEPDTVTLLLEKCAAFIGNYCLAIKETGVNGVIMAEPAAGLISNKDCLTYVSPYIRTLVKLLQDDDFMVVLHNCGNTGHCTPSMVATGAKALHFGNKIDMLKALADTPSDRLVMGNIDPVGMMKQAAPDVVKANVAALLRATAAYPNFVLSTGCDVPPGIPFENIVAFYEALNQYNHACHA
jgi:uroporphyrinogen decarboxylase